MFDFVDHERIGIILKEMGVPIHNYGSIMEKMEIRMRQSKQSLERRPENSTSGNVSDKVASGLICYSTSTQRK